MFIMRRIKPRNSKLLKRNTMTTIKTKILILFAFIVILPGCSNDKSDTKVKTNSVEEVSKTPSKKKKDQTKKNTIVKVDATINGEKIIIDQIIDPKQNNVVVLLNEGIQFKYADSNNQVVLVHLYDPSIYKSTPNSFTQQIATLPREEQVIVKVKSSKLSISTSNTELRSLNISELFEGDVILQEFTEDKVSIRFKGKGFSVGSNNAKNKLFPMEGTIVVENYNIADGRF